MNVENPKRNIYLIHGDSALVVPELLKERGRGFADAIITDPPYGCVLPGGRQFSKDIPAFPSDVMWNELTWPCVKEDGAVVMFGEADSAARIVATGIRDFKYFYAADSLKSRGHLNCNRRPMLRHILISVFYRKTPVYNAQMDSELTGTRYATDMLRVIPTGRREIYPHERNVRLLEFFVKTYTREGETVFDFCMGAGSLAEACYNTNRTFIGIELIDETYRKALNRIRNL